MHATILKQKESLADSLIALLEVDKRSGKAQIEKLSNRIEVKALARDLQSERVKIDDQFSKNIQVLGLFVAVITFLFGNLQYFGGEKVNLKQLAFFNLGVILGVSWLMMLLFILFRPHYRQSLLKMPEFYLVTSLSLLLLLFYIAFSLTYSL
jgi:hypothetical protein